MDEHIYVYGVISSLSGDLPVLEGICQEKISVYFWEGIGIIHSIYPEETFQKGKLSSSRKNLMAHQKVIEVLLSRTTILPFQFGMITTRGELQHMLQQQYGNLKHQLSSFIGKVELNLKVFWKDMERIFAEISEMNEEIKELKAHILTTGQNIPTHENMLKVGQLVQEALETKRTVLAQKMLEELKPVSQKALLSNVSLDALVLNASFLVDKEKESLFDEAVNKLGTAYEDTMQFKYVGPLAPGSFINLTL